MTDEKWKGKFFESDDPLDKTEYEPDHVVTVSELTGSLPTLPEKEMDDYRQLLAEIRKPPYTPPVEKKLSRGMKIALVILALLGSIAGALLVPFLTAFALAIPFSLSRLFPEAISTFIFLFATFLFFVTKGKTEKFLMIIYIVAAVFTVCFFFTLV